MNSEIIVFKPSSENREFEIILDGEHDTIWASEQQMMDLFGKARRTIGEHIRNIYAEEELDRELTWRENRHVQTEGKRSVERKLDLYNLDVVLSVGYRVKSPMATEFRKWATQKLKEYLVISLIINLIKN